jgi:membrane protein YdbS with pleckstrin-like domain
MVFKPFRTFITIIAVFYRENIAKYFENKKSTVERFTFLFNVAYVLLFTLLACVILFPSLLLLCYILVNVLTLVFLVLIVYSIIYLYYKRNR